MTQYVEGDADAFTALYGYAAPRLLSYLLRMCGARDVAEDLLQECLIKVHKARSGYTIGANPMPWFYAIAHRTFLDHARKQKRTRVRAAGAPQALPEVAAHITGARNEDYEEPRADMSSRIESALATLPASQRQAVVLTKIEGLSLADAAAIAGTTVGAMKLRVHRAYGNLRKSPGLEELLHE